MKNFERFFTGLIDYADFFGDTLVPHNYVCDDGYKLGMHVINVRNKRTKLTKEQTSLLNAINFCWNAIKIHRVFPGNFEKYFASIQEYYEKHGDCNIPQLYVNERGEKVGLYATRIREMKNTFNKKQIERLNGIHFIWAYKNKRMNFEEFCSRYQEYEQRVGHKYVPNRYIEPDGIRFGQMCRNIRDGRRKTTPEQKARLDEIGFVWDMNKYCKEAGIIREKRGRKKQFNV